MNTKAFRPERITRKYRQTINAAPHVVFPLLCPVREAEWLDGWRYEMIYSDSGLVEEGAVFRTPHHGDTDTIWVVTKYDVKTAEVEFTRFTPNATTCVLKIAVISKDENNAYVDIAYTYTGLSPEGNSFIENFTEETFLEAVIFWEKSMNYFLETGQQLKKTE